MQYWFQCSIDGEYFVTELLDLALNEINPEYSKKKIIKV